LVYKLKWLCLFLSQKQELERVGDRPKHGCCWRRNLSFQKDSEILCEFPSLVPTLVVCVNRWN